MKDYAKGPVKGREGATRLRLWSDKYGYVHLQGDEFYRCLLDGTEPKYGKSVARDLTTIINEACSQAIADTRRAERRRAARIVTKAIKHSVNMVYAADMYTVVDEILGKKGTK